MRNTPKFCWAAPPVSNLFGIEADGKVKVRFVFQLELDAGLLIDIVADDRQERFDAFFQGADNRAGYFSGKIFLGFDELLLIAVGSVEGDGEGLGAVHFYQLDFGFH